MDDAFDKVFRKGFIITGERQRAFIGWRQHEKIALERTGKIRGNLLFQEAAVVFAVGDFDAVRPPLPFYISKVLRPQVGPPDLIGRLPCQELASVFEHETDVASRLFPQKGFGRIHKHRPFGVSASVKTVKITSVIGQEFDGDIGQVLAGLADGVQGARVTVAGDVQGEFRHSHLYRFFDLVFAVDVHIHRALQGDSWEHLA